MSFDFKQLFATLTMDDTLAHIAIQGAALSDEQWAKQREETLNLIATSIDEGRAKVRHQITETLFRKDEKE